MDQKEVDMEKVRKTAQEVRKLLDGLTYEEAMETLQIAGENLQAYAVIQLGILVQVFHSNFMGFSFQVNHNIHLLLHQL